MNLSHAAEKALVLLGQGVSIQQAALAIGVTEGYISQLMAQEEFANEVATLRFNNLQEHNTRDKAYDELEDALLTKMKDSIPLLMKPMEIRATLKTINEAKRRGTSAPSHLLEKHQIVQVVLPAIIQQHFTANVNGLNQVVSVGEKDITTLQSASLLSKYKEEKVHVQPKLPSAKSVASIDDI